MNHVRLIVSNKMEEYISIQRVKQATSPVFGMEQCRFDKIPPSAASNWKVSEYNQEIPQSQTVDQPKAP